MFDETIYQEAVVSAVGPGGVGGASQAASSGVAGGEARAGASGQEADKAASAEAVMAVPAWPHANKVTGGQTEGGAGVGQGQAEWGDFSFGAMLREYESLRAEIEAMPASQIVTVRVDVQKVAALVITLMERDAAPERRKKFERFAAQGDYDITLLERLPALARSVWVLRRQQQRVQYVTSGAAVSEADRLAAFELRSRMMMELEYLCGDLPGIRTELEYLRQGAGHQDMANDLETLADLYRRPDVRAVLEKSPKYRPGDVAEALRLAGLLLRSLGMSREGEIERLTGLLQRATTLMLRAYDKHCVRGKFLFHEVEDVEATYPSLYSAVRNPRRKRRADEPSGGDSGGEAPGDDDPGDGEPGDDGPGPALTNRAAASGRRKQGGQGVRAGLISTGNPCSA